MKLKMIYGFKWFIWRFAAVLLNILIVYSIFYFMMTLGLPLINEIGLLTLDKEFTYAGDYNAFVMLPMIALNVLLLSLTCFSCFKLCKRVWLRFKTKFSITFAELESKLVGKPKHSNLEYQTNDDMQISEIKDSN